jgi:hypothetical protein
MFLHRYFGFRKMEFPEHNRKANVYPSLEHSYTYYVNAFFALHIRIYRLLLECIRF